MNHLEAKVETEVSHPVNSLIISQSINFWLSVWQLNEKRDVKVKPELHVKKLEHKANSTTPVKSEVWLKVPFRNWVSEKNFGDVGTRNIQLEKTRENDGTQKIRLIPFQV